MLTDVMFSQVGTVTGFARCNASLVNMFVDAIEVLHELTRDVVSSTRILTTGTCEMFQRHGASFEE